MNMRIVLLTLLCMGLACFLPVAAQERNFGLAAANKAAEAKPEKRIALIIGNATYKAAPPLANPTNDAKAMAELMKDLGFELVGKQALLDADKNQIERAIREFGTLLRREQGVGFFYYAGHGIQVNGQNFLIPVAAKIGTERDVKYELVDMNFVLDEMSSASNRLNMVLLDACRNNPFGTRKVRSFTAGLAQVQAPNGTLIGYATQPGNVAADGSGGNSPYTDALLKVLRKPGIGVLDAFNEVGLMVQQTTNGTQQPWMSASPIQGQFYFNPSKASEVIMQQASPEAADVTYWESIKLSRNRTDFETYLALYPNGKFVSQANARIADIKHEQEAANESARAMVVNKEEYELWNNVKDSQNPDDIRLYIIKYPTGRYEAEAWKALRRLRAKK